MSKGIFTENDKNAPKKEVTLRQKKHTVELLKKIEGDFQAGRIPTVQVTEVDRNELEARRDSVKQVGRNKQAQKLKVSTLRFV